jgi:hypothetical protein
MQDVADDQFLAKIKLDAHLAVKRAQKMLEFLRVVCQNERRILHGPAQTSQAEYVRPPLQAEDSERRS